MKVHLFFLIFLFIFQENAFSKQTPILIIKNEIETLNLKPYTQYNFGINPGKKIFKNADFQIENKSNPTWTKIRINNKSKNENFVLILKNKIIPNTKVFLDESKDFLEIKKSLLNGTTHSFPIHMIRDQHYSR